MDLFCDDVPVMKVVDILKFYWEDSQCNKNTVSRYFSLFGEHVLDTYDIDMSKVRLTGHIELDETHLYNHLFMGRSN